MAKNFDQAYREMYLNTMYPEPLEAETARAMPRQSAAAGGKEVPFQTMADIPPATVKGAVQGFLGMPGDVESISYGVKEIMKRGAGESVLDAFMKGIGQKTILPTTEDVKKWLDTNVGKVGSGEHPFETVGEVIAPSGYIKGAAKAVAGAKAAGKALAPKVGEMAEDYLRRTGGLMDIVELPRVDSINRFPLGPTSIKPKVVAPDAKLHREMSSENLTDFLRDDKQFTYAPVFVTDNPDLALGQGANKGVRVTFRPNSVSGEENTKPASGIVSGKEYKADVFAPQAIESITFATEADLKKVRSLAARVLQTEFERVGSDKKNITFVRKTDKEKK